MSEVHQLLNEYGTSHQNKFNKAIHWICIPLIMFSIVGLLWSIPTPIFMRQLHVNWGLVAVVFVLFYYIIKSPALATGMFLFLLFLVALCFFLDNGTNRLLYISLVTFVVAWAAQIYGHKVEGKKPSFLKDLQFLLIGPAWLLAFIYKKLKINF